MKWVSLCFDKGRRELVRANMANGIKRALFILMRLYHNQAGNTHMIVAASIFPLTALISGGVDISRL